MLHEKPASPSTPNSRFCIGCHSETFNPFVCDGCWARLSLSQKRRFYSIATANERRAKRFLMAICLRAPDPEPV